MTDNNVIKLAQPGTFIDSLTEILRSGARALLTQAVEAEVAEFLHRHCDLKTEAGRRRVVRHGHLAEREIMSGIGPVVVRQPRIRDREAAAGERIRFNPTILPPYARRTKVCRHRRLLASRKGGPMNTSAGRSAISEVSAFSICTFTRPVRQVCFTHRHSTTRLVLKLAISGIFAGPPLGGFPR